MDDLAISSENEEDVHSAMELIKKAFIEVKVKESHEMSYLGMNLKITDDGVEVDMVNYIEEILKEFEGVHEYTHPADDKLFVIGENGQPSNNARCFHRIVAKLLFLCMRGRPDIALPVHYLCTRVNNPTAIDDQKLKRIVGFMKSTLKHSRKIDSKPFDRVEAYIDAAHAVHEDGFGRSGGVIMVGGTTVECITRKQKCVARDSTEAEMVALEAIVLDIEWHHEWFKGQGYDLKAPLIFQDNTSTITLVTKGGGKMRNKTMRVKQAVILEGFKNGDFEFEYVPTDDMVADIYTKPLSGMKYYRFKKIIMGNQESKAAGVRRNMVKNG